jgi:PIN domain nuclease of toxin-antitoxin system
MKILLDTHVWIWLLAGSENLNPKLKTILGSEDNEIWLSPISVWETLVLGEKKRLRLLPDPISWVQRALAQGSFREAALNTEVAIRSRQIKLPHQDPADRFLAATAMIYDLTLATQDRDLKNILDLKVL